MPPAPSAREVLRARSVKALLALVALSTAGSVIQAVALGKFVFDTTDRELDLGFVGLAEFAPAAILVLVTGHVADRFDRRTVVRIALSGEVLCSAALAWYVSTEPTAVGPIFALSAAYGVARAFARSSVAGAVRRCGRCRLPATPRGYDLSLVPVGPHRRASDLRLPVRRRADVAVRRVGGARGGRCHVLVSHQSEVGSHRHS